MRCTKIASSFSEDIKHEEKVSLDLTAEEVACDLSRKDSIEAI